MKRFSGIKNLWSILLLVVQAVPVHCLAALLLSVGFMILSTFTVQVTAQLFENADAFYRGNSGSFDGVRGYALLFVGMQFLRSILIFLSGVNGNVYICRKATHNFRQRLAVKAAKLPLISYEDVHVSDMLARAQAVVTEERMSDQFRTMLDVINDCFTVVGIAMVLFGYSPWFLVIAVPSVLPYFVMRMIRGKEFYKMKYFQAQTKRHMDYYWSLLFDMGSRKEIRVYNFADYIKEKWCHYRDEVDEQTWDFKRRDSAVMLLMNGISLCGYLLSIVLSALLLMDDQITVGVLGACLSAFLSMQNKTRRFLINLGSVFEGVQFNRDYLEFIRLPESQDGKWELKGVPEQITMDQVSFRYPNSSKDVIHDVSLQIKRGESVVLVGENGSGKSTLIKLLLGLYECESGTVLMDEVPISQIKKESFYRRLSLMMQNSLNHKGTVREAVALSDVRNMGDDRKLLEVLRRAKIDYILGDDGLDTRLGKEFGGKELSGGEWQKLALARALFKDSDFVVLDEPTSAIDPIAEMELLKTFLTYCKGKTAVIVSHRVGICTCADKVVMMKDGQVVACGSHRELMNSCGAYHELFTAQAEWYR